MKIFNLLFYIILFVSFVLPNNRVYYFDLVFINLSIREIAFLFLPILNLLSFSSSTLRFKYNIKKIKKTVWLLFTVVFITELLKIVYFENPLSDLFKSFRFGLPFFSSMLLLTSEIKVDINKTWNVLLTAIVISNVLTVLSFIFNQPLYPISSFSSSYESIEIGRFFNSNAHFAFIAVFFLFDEGKRYSFLEKTVAISSILVLILSFSRTAILILFVYVFFLGYKNLSLKVFFRFAFIIIVSIGVFSYSYNSNEIIKNQIDKRFIHIVRGSTTINESIYENNRKYIVDGVLEKISQGYWVLGIPINMEMFTYNLPHIQERIMYNTDTTIINILLKYGVIPLALFMMILMSLLKKNRKIPIIYYTIILLLIISINADSLLRYNDIFFLIILILYINFNYGNSIYSKDRLKH